MLTAAQLPSHVRGKPLLQLEASAQQTLFSWFVMALRAERGSAAYEAPVRGQRRDVFEVREKKAHSSWSWHCCVAGSTCAWSTGSAANETSAALSLIAQNGSKRGFSKS